MRMNVFCIFEDSDSTLQNKTINWNCCILPEFTVSNGVITGCCLKLSYLQYLNDLFKELRNAGLGCHINGMFTGAFIYAVDIILIAPSRKSICKCKKVYVMQVCELYATKQDIILNRHLQQVNRINLFCKLQSVNYHSQFFDSFGGPNLLVWLGFLLSLFFLNIPFKNHKHLQLSSTTLIGDPIWVGIIKGRLII